MIKLHKKKCGLCGEARYIYGLRMCEPCYRKTKAQVSFNGRLPSLRLLSPLKGSKTSLKPLSPAQQINKKSKRRVEEERVYRKLVAKMDKVLRKECFFCGSEIKGRKWDPHHLDGRSEHYITPGLLVHSHPKCHFSYHNISFHKLPWRFGYLERIRTKGEQLYEREKMKLDK